MASRRTSVLAILAVLVLGGTAYLATRPDSPPPASTATPAPAPAESPSALPGAELFVVPGGDGDCTQADPCGSLNDGLAAASPGATVRLAAGSYPSQLLRGQSSHAGAPVRLVSDPANPAELKQLLIEARNLEIVGVRVVGEVRVRDQAVDVTLDNLNIDGILDIEGDRTVVRDSRVLPESDRDAVQVRSGPTGVQLIDNVVGPGRRSPGSPAHVDCLQVSWASDLLVEGNTFFRCPAQTILIKADRGPITGVMIRGNTIQGCLTRTETCDGFKTLQIRTAQEMRDIVVKGNSIDGAVVFDSLPGLVITRNVMTGDPGCTVGATDNIVAKSSCPDANRVADVAFPSRTDDVPDLTPGPACACEGYGAPRR